MHAHSLKWDHSTVHLGKHQAYSTLNKTVDVAVDIALLIGFLCRYCASARIISSSYILKVDLKDEDYFVIVPQCRQTHYQYITR